MTTSAIETFKNLGLATTQTSSNAKAAGGQSLGQAEFLKLLTTQMTHQDPTKPMDGTAWMSQLAQFSTASGIQDLQASFKDFAASISSDQALQAASLVGRYVSAPSSEALLSVGEKVSGDFVLPTSSNDVSVKIINPRTGQTVKTIDLDTQSAGKVIFEWDGMDENDQFANAGVYKIEAYANIDGTNTQLETNIKSKVQSVTMGSGSTGLQVNLVGVGAVQFNKIKQIL